MQVTIASAISPLAFLLVIIYSDSYFAFSLLHRLNYDAATNTYTPNAGVSVRVVGANGSDVKDVEFVGPTFPIRIFPYFHNMVEYFVARGYVRDVSIRAAPYDWRFAAGIQ